MNTIAPPCPNATGAPASETRIRVARVIQFARYRSDLYPLVEVGRAYVDAREKVALAAFDLDGLLNASADEATADFWRRKASISAEAATIAIKQAWDTLNKAMAARFENQAEADLDIRHYADELAVLERDFRGRVGRSLPRAARVIDIAAERLRRGLVKPPAVKLTERQRRAILYYAVSVQHRAGGAWEHIAPRAWQWTLRSLKRRGLVIQTSGQPATLTPLGRLVFEAGFISGEHFATVAPPP
jgi:hypothetical protein